MASIASLSVSLTAHTAAFGASMKRASRTVSTFSAGVAASALKVTKWAAATAAAAATAGAYFTAQSMAMIDSTGKLADQLGTTTEKLIGLRHAAEIAGGGAELMNSSLVMLNKRLGDVSESKDVAVGLGMIGLNMEGLFGMDPADQFKLIAEGVSKLKTQTQKAGVATAIFGRSGSDLINILDLGSAGLEKMADDAQILGLNFSRIDAAKVELANDAFARLGATTRALFDKIAIAASVPMKMIVNAFADWGATGMLSANGITDSMIAAGKTMAGLLDYTDALVSVLYSLEEAAHNVAAAFKTSHAFLQRYVDVAANYYAGGGASGMQMVNDNFNDRMGGAQQSRAAAAGARSNAIKSGADFFAGTRSKEAIDSVTNLYNKATKDLEDQRKKRDDMADVNKTEAIAAAKVQFNQEWAKKFVGGASDFLKGWVNGKVQQAKNAGFSAQYENVTPTSSVSRVSSGTWSGEFGGRATAGHTIANQQLEQLKELKLILRDINGNVAGGAVAR